MRDYQKFLAEQSSTITSQRARHVSRMRASFAIEGLNPDPVDVAMQARYIDGTASLADLLTYAASYATQHAPSAHRA